MRTDYDGYKCANKPIYNYEEDPYRTQSSAKDFLLRSSRVMAERIMEDADDPVKETCDWFAIDKEDFKVIKAAAKAAREADRRFDILMSFAHNKRVASRQADPSLALKELAEQYCMTEEEVTALIQEAYKG